MLKRIIIVIVSLFVIWAVFAPKGYGQSKKPDSCSLKYRWVEKGVKYKEVKDTPTLSAIRSGGVYLSNQTIGGYSIPINTEPSTIEINDNPKNPITVKIGDEIYIVWKKKIYRQVYKQPKTIK